MLLLKVKPVRVVHQFMQYLDFHETLNRILLFILYNFHSVHRVGGQVYTFNYLTKGALSQILDNLILMIIRRNYNLVLLENILSARTDGVILYSIGAILSFSLLCPSLPVSIIRRMLPLLLLLANVIDSSPVFFDLLQYLLPGSLVFIYMLKMLFYIPCHGEKSICCFWANFILRLPRFGH